MPVSLILIGDVREKLKELHSDSIHCCVTSPPYYGLRDYGVAGQIGLEQTPEEYVAALVAVFHEVRRVLRDDGTLWLNLGDSYNNSGSNRNGEGLDGVRRGGASGPNGRVGYKKRDLRHSLLASGIKHKDLMGIPWRVAFALQADGWYLRQDIIWSKPNPMPESVKDRCTKAHEYVFMLSKSERYWYDAAAIAEPATYVGVAGQDANGFKNPLRFDGKLAASHKTDKQSGHPRKHAGFNARWDAAESRGEVSETRNKRSVWNIATRPYEEAHFATFPPELPELCIKAGCPVGGTVLDPFGGAGTTAMVADRLGRDSFLIELNPEYAEMARLRIHGDAGMFANVETTA